MAEPEFYLASTEGYDLEEPRGCWRLDQLRTTTRNDLLLVRVDPPLIGQKYGLGDRDIDLLVVAPRHVGVSLTPISGGPVYVHVARLLVDLGQRDTVRPEDLQVIAWAELYATERDAREAVAGASAPQH